MGSRRARHKWAQSRLVPNGYIEGVRVTGVDRNLAEEISASMNWGLTIVQVEDYSSSGFVPTYLEYQPILVVLLPSLNFWSSFSPSFPAFQLSSSPASQPFTFCCYSVFYYISFLLLSSRLLSSLPVFPDIVFGPLLSSPFEESSNKPSGVPDKPSRCRASCCFCANVAEKRKVIFSEVLFSELVSPMMSCHWQWSGTPRGTPRDLTLRVSVFQRHSRLSRGQHRSARGRRR